MGEFVEVSTVDELKDGTMKAVTVGEREILLARVGDKYYAADNRCPHMGGDLSRGKLGGTIVTCPRHGSQFDLTNGRVVRWTDWTGVRLSLAKLIKSPRPIKTYEVKIEGNKVLVEGEKVLVKA